MYSKTCKSRCTFYEKNLKLLLTILKPLFIGRIFFSPLSATTRMSTENPGMSLSSAIDGGQLGTVFGVIGYLLRSGFPADQICALPNTTLRPFITGYPCGRNIPMTPSHFGQSGPPPSALVTFRRVTRLWMLYSWRHPILPPLPT